MESQGDPRVHLAMNVVLSLAFVALLLWGLDLLGSVEFTYARLAVGTLVLVGITHVVTQ